MAIAAATVWEIRTTASDLNAGGYRAGGTGTDYSQADAPLIAFTDLAVDAADATKVTSAQVGFTAALADNLLRVSSGGGFTAGVYWVVSVTGGVATLDRAVGTAGSSGGTGRIGGALASVVELAARMVSSNKAFIRLGTYTNATVITFAAATVTPSNTVAHTHLIGYATTRGDITPFTANQAARPNILVTTLNANVLSFTNAGWKLENLIVGPSGVATCGTGITLGSFNGVVLNCKAMNYSSRGIIANNTPTEIIYCEVTGGTGGQGIFAAAATAMTVAQCWVHEGVGAGIQTSNYNLVHGNLVTNMTGAASDGIVAAAGTNVIDNTISRAGRHGIAFTSTLMTGLRIQGNLIAECGGWGIQGSAAAIPASYPWDGNAFFANTSGTRQNMDDTSAVAVDAVAPYANTQDEILTADPFVDRANNDFRLNNAAGGGAQARGMGLPRTWPGNTATVGYPDMGAVQSQATGGGNTYSRGRVVNATA
jgi:hypothetical protein